MLKLSIKVLEIPTSHHLIFDWRLAFILLVEFNLHVQAFKICLMCSFREKKSNTHSPLQ